MKKDIKRLAEDARIYYKRRLDAVKTQTEWQIKKTTYGQQPFAVR